MFKIGKYVINFDMKKNVKYMILVTLSIILLSCANFTQKQEASFSVQEQINNLADLKKFDDFDQIFNSDSSAVIVIKRVKPNNINPFPTKEFFIYSFIDTEIIYEDSIAGGKVYWLDDENVVIETVTRQERIDKMIEDKRIYNINKRDFK